MWFFFNRYESTITAQFFGHTHFDEFQLFYDPKDLGRAVGVSYISPSVTPFVNLNPGYRVYYVDGDRDHSTRVRIIYFAYVTLQAFQMCCFESFDEIICNLTNNVVLNSSFHIWHTELKIDFYSMQINYIIFNFNTKNYIIMNKPFSKLFNIWMVSDREKSS